MKDIEEQALLDLHRDIDNKAFGSNDEPSLLDSEIMGAIEMAMRFLGRLEALGNGLLDSALVSVLKRVLHWAKEKASASSPRRMTDEGIDEYLKEGVKQIHKEDLWRWRRQIFDTQDHNVLEEFWAWWTATSEYKELETRLSQDSEGSRVFLGKGIPVERYKEILAKVQEWDTVRQATVSDAENPDSVKL